MPPSSRSSGPISIVLQPTVFAGSVYGVTSQTATAPLARDRCRLPVWSASDGIQLSLRRVSSGPLLRDRTYDRRTPSRGPVWPEMAATRGKVEKPPGWGRDDKGSSPFPYLADLSAGIGTLRGRRLPGFTGPFPSTSRDKAVLFSC